MNNACYRRAVAKLMEKATIPIEIGGLDEALVVLCGCLEENDVGRELITTAHLYKVADHDFLKSTRRASHLLAIDLPQNNTSQGTSFQVMEPRTKSLSHTFAIRPFTFLSALRLFCGTGVAPWTPSEKVRGLPPRLQKEGCTHPIVPGILYSRNAKHKHKRQNAGQWCYGRYPRNHCFRQTIQTKSSQAREGQQELVAERYGTLEDHDQQEVGIRDSSKLREEGQGQTTHRWVCHFTLEAVVFRLWVEGRGATTCS